jgi:elongation factor Ts
MAAITAADVKKLRDLTGAGMMECKKALTDSEGDFEKAVELLRISGAAKAAKRAERKASNGLVANKGRVLVELLCETDFVAKNADFQALADEIVALAVSKRISTREKLAEAKLASGKTVLEEIQGRSGVIGEKLELGRVGAVKGKVASYMHKRNPDLPPQSGVLVSFTGTDEDAARLVGMQVAAMRPEYLSRADVPEDVVANERRIAEATAKEEGKPAGALPKIVEGRVNGFYKERVLLDQAFVQDQKKTVAAFAKDHGIEILDFVRVEIGQ